MNEETKERFLAHAFDKHIFNIKYYRQHRDEKHDYNVEYYKNNKDKWDLKGGTNATGGSTNPRPTTKTTSVSEDPNYLVGPRKRQKGLLEKTSDALIKHIPGYAQLYTDTQDFLRPLTTAVHRLKGWKKEGEEFSLSKMNVSLNDVKSTLNYWMNRFNEADRKYQDIENKVTTAINDIFS